MPDIEYGLTSTRRDRGSLVELPVVNMFAEKALSEPRQVVLQSRPGLDEDDETYGSGPVQSIYQEQGVLGGSRFVVSDGKLYRDAAYVGVITGSGPVSMAGNEIGLCITAGRALYFYNGTALAAADFPDNAYVRKVAELAGRFVAIRDGTQKFYWTAPLENALIDGDLVFDALDFASAENEPDSLLDMLVLGGELVLFGTSTVEFWPKTGDSELPFVPMEGRVYTKGIVATGCAAVFDNFAVWVGNEGLVYVGGQVPEVLSNDGIDERIAASTTYRVFTFFFEGHEFFALRLDGETWLYNAKTRQWCEFQSFGLSNWICQCAGGGVFGSAIDGRLFRFGSGHEDLGGPLERQFRFGQAIAGGSVRLNRVRLGTNPGQTPYLTGQYADPMVELRMSNDAGQSWGDWRSAPLGAQGRYRDLVEFRALGTFDYPGFLGEVRVSNPVPFRVSTMTANEPGSGRSR